MHERARQPDLVPLERRDAWLALLLATILCVSAGFRAHTDVCGQCHDDAIYVLTAKALAEGEGYRLVNLPGEPPQTKYPPLYPALLAGLWKLWPDFPANLLLLQGFSILCSAAFLATAYLYVVRFNHATRGVAFSACLLCSVYSSFLFFAVVTMSEALFSLIMVGMLWWIESAIRRPESRPGADFLGGVLLALPFLCRTIGLLFIPLGLLLLWQHGKRWRWATLGAMVATIPWLVWTASAASDWKNDPVQGYYTDYLGWWSSFGLPAISRIITYNLLWFITSVSSPLLDGLTESYRLQGKFGPWFILNGLPGLLALCVLARDVMRGRVLPTVLVSYILLVCVWPWTPHRFLMPLLPFLTVYLLRGLMLPASQPNLGKIWPRLALGSLVLAFVVSAREHVRMVELRRVHDTPNPEQREKLHAWKQTRALLDWIETHTEKDDVIASGADPMISLYTGRKAYYPIICPPLSMFYAFPYPTEEVYSLSLKAMRHYRPRYLALTANFHNEDEFRAWVELMQQRHPDLLHRVYTDSKDERFTVYEIHYPADFGATP
jgi:hypothetical protein